jgi:hypothetical protein
VFVFKGVCFALAANALWALAFLAPYVSGALHGADFVFLRFSFYGGLAAAVILAMRRNGVGLNSRNAMKAMTLGAVGYAFSFLCTYLAVELSGGVPAALLLRMSAPGHDAGGRSTGWRKLGRRQRLLVTIL